MYYKSTVYVSTLDDRSDRKVCIERNCFSDTSKTRSDKLKFSYDKEHREKRERS